MLAFYVPLNALYWCTKRPCRKTWCWSKRVTKLLISLLCCACLGASAWAVPPAPRALTLCHEDQDTFPWLLTDGRGLNLQLLRQVEHALPVRFRFVAVPWKRCLAGLAQGQYDGAFAASFQPERLAHGHYPLNEAGQPDVRRRLHTAGYALYRRKGSAVDWNGAAFEHVQGAIGSLSGFSIAGFMRGRGITVDETSRDPLILLQRVQRQRLAAAALQTSRGDFVLITHPELAAHIERVERPLEEKAYYLMLSTAYVEQSPTMAERIWTEIEHQRESAAYQQAVEAFMASMAP
jgi:polar amino acid transport system substrate-binding protein